MAHGGYVYFASMSAHVALAAFLASLRAPPAAVSTAPVEIVDIPAPPEPAPPPPPVDEAPAPKPVAAPEPVRAPAKVAAPAPASKAAAAPEPAAAPAANDAPVDLGLALGGGVGGGTMAVPAGGGGGRGPLGPAPRAAARLLAAAPTKDALCTDPPEKPQPIQVPTPAYPDEARAAGVAGKVRIEVTVDETGAVVSARVLAGLGFGLDEAALAAARGARFSPGRKCGQPARTTFVFAMRFDR